MPIDDDQLAKIPLTLRNDACWACGYSLAGLAMSGNCPECGTAFEADALKFPAVAKGTNATMMTAAWPTAAGLALFHIFWAVLQLFSFKLDAVHIIALCSLITWIVLFVRFRGVFGASPAVVVMDKTGYALIQRVELQSGQRRGEVEMIRLYLWSMAALIVMAAVLVNDLTVRLSGAACVIFAIVQGVLWVRRRGQPRKHIDRSSVQLRRWRIDFEVSVAPVSKSRFRLMIIDRTRTPPRADLDAEITCTYSLAEQLADKVELWINGSGQETNAH